MQRKIERDVALERAFEVFWQHGYRGTSMEMLTAEIGVEKPSLYATFGNKHALFLAALGHYRTWLAALVEKTLAAAPSPRAGIERVVAALMMPRARSGRPGCFAANAALEMSDADDAVRAEVDAAFAAIIRRFADVIRAAQAEGEVRKDVPAHVLAKLLMCAIEGVRVLEKTSTPLHDYKALSTLVLSVLDDA